MNGCETRYNPELERLHGFAELRSRVHADTERETADRVQQNPEPSEDEIAVGAFREMVEPQVRDAVFELRRKGYASESSGFGGEFGEVQAIDGYFEIDDETKSKLEALGAKVLKGRNVGLSGQSEQYTFIHLKPESPDLVKIKAVWDQIAALLPVKREPAPPSISGGSGDFRKQYAPDRTDVEREALRRQLALEQYHPDTERQMRRRLEELGG